MATLDRLVRTLDFMPNWLTSLVIFVVMSLLALLLHGLVYSLVTRATGGWSLFWRSLIKRTRGPTRMGFVVIGMAVANALSPLTLAQSQAVAQILQVAIILLLAWIVQTAIHIWLTIYLRRFKLDAEDNLLARKHVTQSRILLRVADVLILIFAISAALMTFDGVRQIGVSILAAGGAAGLILGLALQPVLKNLFAGIQLAITQPIRIDDALVVEGEWGKVEEITSTYVVVRIWDLRRLILPLGYFIENPFQNWTRESAALLGNVMLYLDYGAPVEIIRDKVREIAENSPLWTGEVAGVQVTDFHEDVMELRVLVSAANSGNAFDLRCEVREKLIAFLQAEHPDALPRRRLETIR